MTKPVLEIEYCPGCKWLMRSGWMAQELLSTFDEELGGVTLIPSPVSGTFEIRIVDGKSLWERKRDGGFPEIKQLKQIVRDAISPDKDLGHNDRPNKS